MNHNWTITLSNPIYRGFYPQIDPFDNSSFFIGDGWGSTSPSMKLRKLSIENGHEIQSVRVRNSIRSLHFNSDRESLFATSDNRVFQLNRNSLKIEQNFNKGILKYSDFINSNDKDKIILQNHRGKFLMVFDYLLSKGIKKKVGESSGTILKENNNCFLLFDCFSGTISRYNLTENKVQVIYKTNPFSKVRVFQDETAYLRIGNVNYDEHNIWHIKPENKIRIIDLKNLKQKKDLTIDKILDDYKISENGKEILLWSNNIFKIISTLSNDKVFEYKFDSDLSIVSVMEKQRKIFLYSNYGKREKQLFCYTF